MADEGAAPVCRLCGSTRVVLWGTRPGRKFAERMFQLYRCEACDFRFVDPVTGPEIYDDDYYAGRGVDPLVDYETEYRDYRSSPRVHEFRGLAELVEAHFAAAQNFTSFPHVVRWLDFGCGAGGLLMYLRDRRNLSVAGSRAAIEPSGFDVGAYATRLRERDELRVYTDNEVHNLPDAMFDVVSLVEVIEHVARPLDLLSLCSRLLRPGGLLVLTTGNLACPLARWQGVQFGYCIPEIHVSLWTPRSLLFGYQKVGLLPRRFRCDGSLRFKISKNLARFEGLKAAGSLWYSRPVVSSLDWLFGVSNMPMAVKPEPATAFTPGTE